MITLDPKYKQDVQTIREAHKAHNDMIDYFIKKIGERAGFKTEEEHEILWDHILNDADWSVQYKEEKTNESSN